MSKNNVVAGHKIKWFVYAGSERIPYRSAMRGAWGFDAVCECGWDSRTGGATRAFVQGEVDVHKWEIGLRNV